MTPCSPAKPTQAGHADTGHDARRAEGKPTVDNVRATASTTITVTATDNVGVTSVSLTWGGTHSAGSGRR